MESCNPRSKSNNYQQHPRTFSEVKSQKVSARLDLGNSRVLIGIIYSGRRYKNLYL